MGSRRDHEDEVLPVDAAAKYSAGEFTMSEFKIGNRKIDRDHAPFVIAEVGINHEGSLEKALSMVDAAANAGADCVKFQTHITEEEMIPTDMTPGQISDERLWDIIKRCELSRDEERQVFEYCNEKGIQFLSTPFSRAAADRLNDLGVVAYKIGSGECNNYPLIRHVAGFGKPMIVSTGMNDLDSIAPAVTIVLEAGCPLILLHCTSMYPTPYEDVRLGAIPELRERFGVDVGLSDHSIGVWTAIGSIAMGAVAVEKHFTLSRSWPGPDVPISIEPEELRHLVEGSRAVWRARGGRKNILPGERPVIDFAYATVVTLRDIKEGETLTVDNVWVKRPGTGGIHARDYDRVLGMTVARDLEANSHVNPEDLVEYHS